MVSLKVYNKSGQEVGVCEVDTDKIAPTITKQLLHDAVVMYQANIRQGSAKTKNRGEVRGSKKKMYRQKGTGNARAGHKRSGVRRGGGHIFSLTPRDWSYRLPRKALQAATRMALVSKIRDNQVILIDELAIAAPKTKEVASILTALKIDTSVLLALETHSEPIYKSARNIEGVSVLPVSDLNAYALLRPRRVLMTKAALEAFVASNSKETN
ncbi:MAG: 50S ribosomal protein L4 [Thermoguttaceae bacterium]